MVRSGDTVRVCEEIVEFRSCLVRVVRRSSPSFAAPTIDSFELASCSLVNTRVQVPRVLHSSHRHPQQLGMLLERCPHLVCPFEQLFSALSFSIDAWSKWSG